MDEQRLAEIEAKYEAWSKDWRELLPEEVELITEVRRLREERDEALNQLELNELGW